MFVDAVSFAFGLLLLAGFCLVAYLIGREVRDVELAEPASHVKLAGVRRRCVRCNKIRQTMDFAEGWGPRHVALPHCGPCLRDLLDLDHGDGEVVA